MDENRIKHSLAVARKMVEIGKEYGLDNNELQDLFVLGLNHDIGYEYGEHANHEHVGGELLKRNNYKYWQEVYYHGDIKAEYNSIYLDILNKADMQIDRYGNDVGYEKRLADIRERYGEQSETLIKAVELIEKLKRC